ncbi:MAG: hypothetical protein K1X92_08105 [Bacteroidia bacterium]|nr:hypothetical protein [Bacteroidia bacterium]
MRLYQPFLYFLFFVTLALFSGCDNFFGKKTSKDFLDVPIYNDKTVAYVPVQPVWSGFDAPTDILIGWDQLIYVVDSGKQTIFAYDEAGNELGKILVPGVTAVTQDRALDLLALGTKDTLVSGVQRRLPALYRIHQINGAGQVGLSEAKITRVLIHPFCFNIAASPTATDEQVRFKAVGVLADNRYYIVRTGNGASGSVQGDAIVLFNNDDVFVSPVSVNTSLGVFNNYFKKPTAISTYAQPPQSPAVSQKGDFLFCSSDPSQVLKVQGIAFKESDAGASYEVMEFPQVTDTAKSDGVLYQAYKFTSPSDVVVAGDGSGYLFITDEAKDSVFIYNGLGYEGVNPPAGSSSSKAVRVSFGGTGNGLLQFRRPVAAAFMNNILYIVDAGNKRILKFKLTTDFR